MSLVCDTLQSQTVTTIWRNLSSPSSWHHNLEVHNPDVYHCEVPKSHTVNALILYIVTDDPYYGEDLGLSDVSVDECYADGGDSRNIFSDPESEWNSPETARKLSIEKLNDMKEAFSLPPNSLPESDQRTNDQPPQRKNSYVIMSNLGWRMLGGGGLSWPMKVRLHQEERIDLSAPKM